MTPSADTLSPGRTNTRSSTCNEAAGTSRCPPCASSKIAVFGTNDANALMPARARSAATPSNNSPTENKKTTAAASSASPIISAPIAAIDINISIENGVPVIAKVIDFPAIANAHMP